MKYHEQQEIVASSVDSACWQLWNDLTGEGTARASPRGMGISEFIGSSVTFDMMYPVCTLPIRKLGYRFMCAEAAWILSGDNRLSTIKQYSPFIWEFSDDGFFYQGAYGPRVIDQLSYVCDVLADDPDTRQAVIEVWRPNPRAGRDIPCTISYQFIAREGKLHCIQNMRSSDAWLGYAYDAFNASMLTCYICLLLDDRKKRARRGLIPGYHTMQIGSSHLYDKNRDMAIKAVAAGATPGWKYNTINLDQFSSPQHLIDHLWALAAQDWFKLGKMAGEHYHLNGEHGSTFLVNELIQIAEQAAKEKSDA